MCFIFLNKILCFKKFCFIFVPKKLTFLLYKDLDLVARVSQIWRVWRPLSLGNIVSVCPSFCLRSFYQEHVKWEFLQFDERSHVGLLARHSDRILLHPQLNWLVCSTHSVEKNVSRRTNDVNVSCYVLYFHTVQIFDEFHEQTKYCYQGMVISTYSEL